MECRQQKGGGVYREQQGEGCTLYIESRKGEECRKQKGGAVYQAEREGSVESRKGKEFRKQKGE
jgi:hypothetical protein